MSDARLSDAEIAQRAYEIYQNRGCSQGADLDDWLQAERELNEADTQIERGKSAVA